MLDKILCISQHTSTAHLVHRLSRKIAVVLRHRRAGLADLAHRRRRSLDQHPVGKAQSGYLSVAGVKCIGDGAPDEAREFELHSRSAFRSATMASTSARSSSHAAIAAISSAEPGVRRADHQFSKVRGYTPIFRAPTLTALLCPDHCRCRASAIRRDTLPPVGEIIVVEVSISVPLFSWRDEKGGKEEKGGWDIRKEPSRQV
jgi:hypothetical protein